VQFDRHVVERLHSLEGARDGEGAQGSLRGSLGGFGCDRLGQGADQVPRPVVARRLRATTELTDYESFGTTFAVTEPTTFSLVPVI
jgi:hypothetical protein